MTRHGVISQVVLDSQFASVEHIERVWDPGLVVVLLRRCFVLHWTIAHVEVALRESVAELLSLLRVESLHAIEMLERVLIAGVEITPDGNRILRAAFVGRVHSADSLFYFVKGLLGHACVRALVQTTERTLLDTFVLKRILAELPVFFAQLVAVNRGNAFGTAVPFQF